MSDKLQDNQPEESAEQEKNHLISPGIQLKKIREDLKLSRDEVAENIYMTVTYIKALEDDEYHKLPGKTFVKGYFKIYADYLNADVDSILASYSHYAQEYIAAEEDDSFKVSGAINQNYYTFWVSLIFVVIGLVAAFVWWF